MKIATPTLNHASCSDWQDVYEPAEDSFLLIDALETDLQLILNKKPTFCLEVGSGSGVIISALATVLHSATFCAATDVNVSACLLTRRTASANSAHVDVLCADLAPFRPGSVDLVVFNPPYVPTPSQELSGRGVSRAWAGGVRGREVIDRFLQEVIPLLSPHGLGYLLLLRENDPEDVADVLRKAGCCVAQVAERRLRGEALLVLRFEKTLRL